MNTNPRVPRILLIAGLVAGIAAAASGVLQRGDDNNLPPDAVARVNDRLIWRDAWLRAVAAVSSERNGALSSEDQRHILERLVDEELLVQHGLSLGLVEQDRRLRGQLVNEVLMNARAQTAPADDETLNGFYEANRDFFAQSGRLQISAYRYRRDQRPQAEQSVLQLRAGVAIAPSWLPPLPAGPLPAAELRTYLGPSLTQAALALKAGEVSEPLDTDIGFAVLKLEKADATLTPTLAAIRGQVAAEWQRRSDEAAVRKLLEELRQSQRVVIRSSSP